MTLKFVKIYELYSKYMIRNVTQKILYIVWREK